MSIRVVTLTIELYYTNILIISFDCSQFIETCNWLCMSLWCIVYFHATGMDIIPAWFLRVGAPVFCRPLARLFSIHYSSTQSCVPTQHSHFIPKSNRCLRLRSQTSYQWKRNGEICRRLLHHHITRLLMLKAGSEKSNIAEQWAVNNNLKVNVAKYMEVVFYDKGSRMTGEITPQPPLPGIKRVSTVKIPGVTLVRRSLCWRSRDVHAVICSAAQTLHTLQVMRVHDMYDAAPQSVFRAVVVSKLQYASCEWCGSLIYIGLDGRLEELLSCLLEGGRTLKLYSMFDVGGRCFKYNFRYILYTCAVQSCKSCYYKRRVIISLKLNYLLIYLNCLVMKFSLTKYSPLYFEL